MLCLVTQPNGFLLEIYLPPKSRGQECLDKVCAELAIIEVDFFGLQYETKNGMYWLNLRNSIRQQSHQSEIIRLELKVKFYVPPYLIQQDSTRHQFYLNLKNNLKQHQLKILDDDTKLAKLIALIAQAEVGNFNDDSFDLKQLYSQWILVFKHKNNNHSVIEATTCNKRRKPNSDDSIEDSVEEEELSRSPDSICSFNDSLTSLIDSKFCQLERLSSEHSKLYSSIVQFHKQLSGYLPSKAESKFLEEVADLEDIGIDYFTVKLDNFPNEKCKIGVGTRGVTIKQSDKKLINYASLVKVRTSTHFFTLKYINDAGEVKEEKFRLASTKSANALYRVVTEKHVFYSCDTVGDSVATQCILGISGMFWSITPSIFKDSSSESGKNFVFDIRRTLRQFYDDVQRTMFKFRTHLSENLTLVDPLEIVNCDNPTSGNQSSELATSPDQQPMSSEPKLLCRICFDRQMCSAFIPCGHVMSCEECGAGCDICPVCRAHIESRLKIFF